MAIKRSAKMMFTNKTLDGLGCALVGKAMGVHRIMYCTDSYGDDNFINVINKTLSTLEDTLDEVYITALPVSPVDYNKIRDSLTKTNSKILIDNHRDALEYGEDGTRVVTLFDKGIVSTKGLSSTGFMFLEYRGDLGIDAGKYSHIVRLINSYVSRNFEVGEKLIADLQKAYDYIVNQSFPRKSLQEMCKKFVNELWYEPPMADKEYPDWYKEAINEYVYYMGDIFSDKKIS